MDVLFVISIVIAFVLFFVFSFFKNRAKKPEHALKELKANYAKRIFTDKGIKNFNSVKYKISARPDFIYEMPDGSKIIVEYKSRTKAVRDSDIVQLIATAIAVKETHPTVREGYIYTQGNHIEKIDLDKSVDELANLIMDEIINARAIKLGARPTFEPIKARCGSCGFKNSCTSCVC